MTLLTITLFLGGVLVGISGTILFLILTPFNAGNWTDNLKDEDLQG